jgi:hypothetical protein
MGTIDDNGIYFYEATDAVSPLHTLLNVGQASVSSAIGNVSDTVTMLEDDVVILTAPTYLEANRTTDLSVANASSGHGTLVTWSSVNINGITNVAGTITVPDAGLYVITVATGWDRNATGYRLLRLMVNDVFVLLDAVTPVTSITRTIKLSAEITLAASDAIKVYARQNSGAALDVTADYTHLSVRRVY